MMEAIRSSESRLTPHLHGATSQKTAFFIVTTVKTSNLTYFGSGFLNVDKSPSEDGQSDRNMLRKMKYTFY
jgi:hypothetical protein